VCCRTANRTAAVHRQTDRPGTANVSSEPEAAPSVEEDNELAVPVLAEG
jgi:hypothetical protein